MNVLIVSQYFWPENFRINELATELSKKGHKVIVYTGLPNYPEGEIYKKYRKNKNNFEKYGDIKVLRVPIIPRGRNYFFLCLNYLSFVFMGILLAPFKLKNENIDIVFTFQTSPIFVGFISAYIAWFKKIPHLMWVLDLWPDTLFAVEVIKSKFILKIIGNLVRFIYSRCNLLLVQSESFKKNIAKYFPFEEKVIFFPAWSDSVFNNKNILPATEIKAVKDKFTIIFAGNLGIGQDLPSIISAFKILKDKKIQTRLIIIGDGRMKKKIKELIKTHKLEKYVFLIGKYPLSKMPSFFKHADALIVSLKDNQIFNMTIPGKIQSYLAAGVPILGMLNGEGAKIIEKANAGLTCKAGDIKSLANIIIKLISKSKRERKELGINGINYSNRYFKKEKLIDKLEKYLENLIYKI